MDFDGFWALLQEKLAQKAMDKLLREEEPLNVIEQFLDEVNDTYSRKRWHCLSMHRDFSRLHVPLQASI